MNQSEREGDKVRLKDGSKIKFSSTINQLINIQSIFNGEKVVGGGGGYGGYRESVVG